jgi:uncharacterized phage-associated protein
MYSARTIALYLIRKADGNCTDFTLLKLLKIMYLIQGHYLAATGKKLFDDPIYAWKYGPVIKSIYDEFKGYGNVALNLVLLNDDYYQMQAEMAEEELSSTDKYFVDAIYSLYIEFTAAQLINITHAEGSPWHEAYKINFNAPHLDVRNIEINSDKIREYYENELSHYKSQN